MCSITSQIFQSLLKVTTCYERKTGLIYIIYLDTRHPLALSGVFEAFAVLKQLLKQISCIDSLVVLLFV